MFYFLSKSIDFLLMPFSWCFILLIFSILTKSVRKKRVAVITALSVLFLISNSFLVNKAFLWWEYKFVNIKDVAKVYDVGVVLSGGMIGMSGLSADHPGLGSHADRFFDAYLLYKAGKIKKILITGTSSPAWMAKQKGETRQAAQLLVKWGVPVQDILFEERARNTRENATYSARILNERFSGGEILLITSSFHMRRALGCFNKAGVKADCFPADFYGGNYQGSLKDILIPDADAIGYFDLLWHEWIGYMTYKVMGYC